MVSKAAGLGRAIAKGVQGYAAGSRDRDAAKVRKAEGEAKLAKLSHQEKTGSVQSQIDALNAQNVELLRVNQQNKTFRSLDAYTADFDPKHLNALINHPMMKDKFNDMASLDKVDVFNDIGFIRKSGFDPAVFTEDETKENASGRYLKATMKDGKKVLVDMMTIYAGTGYARELDQRKLEDLLRKNKINKAKGDKGPGPLERDAGVIAAAEERIKIAEEKGEKPDPKDVQISKLGDKMKGGVRVGQIAEAEDRTKLLVKKFGGEEQFFNTDFGEPENFRKAYADIAAIELLERIEFSSKEKTELNNIRMLIAMGDPSKNLSENETGLYDSTFLTAKKYMSDNVEGVAATSAYAAFRNTVRHALFGSALTEAEIKSFKEAFGTLGQKLGPVLQQFKTALTQVQAKLQSIGRMKNPYSAHVRLGVDDQKMDQILSSLEDRIRMLDEFDVGNKAPIDSSSLKGLGGKKQ